MKRLLQVLFSDTTAVPDLPPVEPSPEAKAALAEAKQIRQKSNEVYGHRAELLERNHFAARIDHLYQGLT